MHVGISERRKTTFSAPHGPLPSAREVSTTVTTVRVILDRLGFNSQIMQWGQFISHDFTHIAQTEGK